MDGLNEDGFYKKRKKAKKSDSSQFGFNLETKISQSNGSNSFVMEQDCNSLGRASQAYTKVKVKKTRIKLMGHVQKHF